MLQHIIDAERVFAYRALRLCRMDPTPLPGFDENGSGHAHDGAAERRWKDLDPGIQGCSGSQHNTSSIPCPMNSCVSTGTVSERIR